MYESCLTQEKLSSHIEAQRKVNEIYDKAYSGRSGLKLSIDSYETFEAKVFHHGENPRNTENTFDVKLIEYFKQILGLYDTYTT